MPGSSKTMGIAALNPSYGLGKRKLNRHCEERSDAAIQKFVGY